MAVSPGSRPILDALRPRPTMIRWILLRLGVVVLSSLPALLVGLAGVANGVAKRPYYTSVEGKLPLAHLLHLLKELPSGFGPAAAIGVVLAVLGDQLLTGGAIAAFDPGRDPAERPRVWQAVFRDGMTHFWAFLRVVGLGVVLSAIGVGLVRALGKRLDVMAYRSAWTGETAIVRLTALTMALTLLWMASAGAWVFWCRLITAADGRRRVRRTGLMVFRVFKRHPLRSWGLFTALTLVTTLASGAVLGAWRHAEPRTTAGALGWALFWLLTLLLQSFVWLWLVRAGRLLYSSDGLADLRAMPDAPFGLFRKLLFWRRRAPTQTATTEPVPAAVVAPAPAEAAPAAATAPAAHAPAAADAPAAHEADAPE